MHFFSVFLGGLAIDVAVFMLNGKVAHSSGQFISCNSTFFSLNQMTQKKKKRKHIDVTTIDNSLPLLGFKNIFSDSP